MREEIPRRVSEVEAAPDDKFSLTADHAIAWESVPIAVLTQGDQVSRPRVRVLDSEFLDGAQRDRLRARLQRYLDAAIRADLAPLFAAIEAAAADPALRGPLHRLSETLGLIPGVDEETLAPDVRPKLKSIGVRSGRLALFVPAVLKPRAAAMRARLWALAHGVPMPALPPPGTVSIPARADWLPGFANAMGWVEAGPVSIRLDIAERVAGELGYLARRGPIVLPADLGSRLSVRAEVVPIVLRALGFRIVPGGGLAAETFGPPAPAMLVPPKRRRLPSVAPMPEARGPFAALAALRV